MANHPRKGRGQAGLRSRESFKSWWAPTISLEQLKLELSNLAYM